MPFHTIEQGVACANIEADIHGARMTIINFEDFISRLQEKIETQEWLIRDLQRQIDRTGDPESFDPDIWQLEADIRNLERQIDNARNEKLRAESDLERAIAEWERSECDSQIA